MNNKGKLLLFLLLLAVAVPLLLPRNRTVYGVSDGGIYHMAAESEDALAPYIRFFYSGNSLRFRSSMDIRISLAVDGTAELRNGKVRTVSDDGKQIWAFEVRDNETLIFLAEDSTVPLNKDGEPVIPDGAVFRFEEF